MVSKDLEYSSLCSQATNSRVGCGGEGLPILPQHPGFSTNGKLSQLSRSGRPTA